MYYDVQIKGAFMSCIDTKVDCEIKLLNKPAAVHDLTNKPEIFVESRA